MEIKSKYIEHKNKYIIKQYLLYNRNQIEVYQNNNLILTNSDYIVFNENVLYNV